MRHVLKSELLQALFDTVRKLDEVKFVNPEPEIVNLRRILLNKIAEIEWQDSDDFPMAA
jgi:hypothetical protein